MEFFNKKEEVLDIVLTRFGKHLLSKGKFKPVYYQFFDDDILYDSRYAGFGEHQNSAESRILEETPKLKTIPNTLGLDREPFEHPYGHDIDNRFTNRYGVNVIYNSSMQERVLLYPIGEFESNSKKAPRFIVNTHEEEFKLVDTHLYDFLQLTSSGVIKGIPQIQFQPEYSIKEDFAEVRERVRFDQEDVFNSFTGEVIFEDNSKLSIIPKNIIIDAIEDNTFYKNDNFILQVYEVIENFATRTTEQNQDPSLREITDIRQINELFHIKTDEDVHEVNIRTGRLNNYYRGEEQ